MNRIAKPLGWSLFGAGLAVMGTAGAISFPWSRPDAAQTPVAVAAAAVAQTAPALPALPPGTAPNYRAIVQQFGPAVVGVTVEGQRKVQADADESDGAEMEPFFRFFRGMQGCPARLETAAVVTVPTSAFAARARASSSPPMV